MRLLTETTVPNSDSNSSPQALMQLSDADLLDAWKEDQHRGSLAELVRRYSVMVLSVCRRRCRTPSDVEDAFQSTFLYLAKNCQKIRQPERLAGWLHRVAQRAAIATTKSSKRETEPMVDPPDRPNDPLDQIAQRHDAIVLDEELADLPEHYRSALVMHIYEDLPLQRLAEHFQTTVGSIRGRLQRGKQLLARRLRGRGVVPVLAFSAAQSWTVSAGQASAASQSFLESCSAGSLPEPPIEPRLLEPLVSQGARLMPSLYTAAGVVAGSALLIAMLVTTDPSNGQNTGGQPETLELNGSPVVAQFGGTVNTIDNSTLANSQAQANTGQDGEELTNMAQVGGGFGGFGMGSAPTPPPVVSTPEPDSEVAEEVRQALDITGPFEFSKSLADLPSQLFQIASIPVLLDPQGIEFAEINAAAETIDLKTGEVPLRTALRQLLEPMGLKVVIDNDGLVITANPSALVRKGIGTSRWINIDNDAADSIAKKLTEKTQFEFVQMPISDALKFIQEQHELPILLNHRAFEDVGLTADEPVTLSIQDIKLSNGLKLLLSQLDLTYSIKGEMLEVTTLEAAEDELLRRIYWLESTGFAINDFQSVMRVIETSIDPNTWEMMGGPSTMSPMGSGRPALLIGTTYDVHCEIEALLGTLRETHFGADPVAKPQPTTNSGSERGGIGGGGLGGGGFGGGGGGGGGFF